MTKKLGVPKVLLLLSMRQRQLLSMLLDFFQDLLGLMVKHLNLRYVSSFVIFNIYMLCLYDHYLTNYLWL